MAVPARLVRLGCRCAVTVGVTVVARPVVCVGETVVARPVVSPLALLQPQPQKSRLLTCRQQRHRLLHGNKMNDIRALYLMA